MGEILDKKLIDYFFTDNYPFFISDTNVLNCLIFILEYFISTLNL
jgi:hypothetical protein